MAKAGFRAPVVVLFSLGLSALSVAQVPAEAAKTKKVEPGCDRTAIEWFRPLQFEKARQKAKSRKRLLIIKGISFGVDAAGAKCATEGTW